LADGMHRRDQLWKSQMAVGISEHGLRQWVAPFPVLQWKNSDGLRRAL
jgi:hypothetical protein